MDGDGQLEPSVTEVTATRTFEIVGIAGPLPGEVFSRPGLLYKQLRHSCLVHLPQLGQTSSTTALSTMHSMSDTIDMNHLRLLPHLPHLPHP